MELAGDCALGCLDFDLRRRGGVPHQPQDHDLHRDCLDAGEPVTTQQRADAAEQAENREDRDGDARPVVAAGEEYRDDHADHRDGSHDQIRNEHTAGDRTGGDAADAFTRLGVVDLVTRTAIEGGKCPQDEANGSNDDDCCDSHAAADCFANRYWGKRRNNGRGTALTAVIRNRNGPGT